MATTIFVIDSSPAVRRMVEQISAPEGYDVVGFQDGPAALEAARRMSPELIIADYHLENITFSGFCKEVHKLDNLSETYIISLVSPADRPDENHLRALGVKAFLKKPFQSNNLLELIKDLQENHHRSQSAPKPKSRAWPPQSVATDSDEDGSVFGEFDDQGEAEESPLLSEPAAEPVRPQAAAAPPPPVEPEPAPPAPPKDSDDSMKALFQQFSASMTERVEHRIAELLPRIIAKELTAPIKKAVQEEARGLMDAALAGERLSDLVRPVVVEELVKAMTRERGDLEPLVKRVVSEMLPPMINDRVEQAARDSIDGALGRLLPDAVREHVGPVDAMVRDEIQQAAAKHGASIADGVVRTSARELVAEAVERIVPDVAESQIRAELKRLTEAE